MTKNRITRNTGNSPLNQPSQGVARFNGDVRSASYGKSVTPLQPIKFSAGGAYMEQMNAIADLGTGIFNATAKVAAASQRAKAAETDAFLAGTKATDLVETDRIYQENMLEGNDPEQLTVKLEAYKTGKMANMPEEIKPHYAQSFDNQAAVLTVRSQNAFFKKAKDDASASLQASKEIIKDDIFENPAPLTEIEAQANQDKMAKYAGALQAQVAHGDITSEEAQLELREFQKETLILGMKTQMKDLTPDQRAAEVKRLQDMKSIPMGLNEEDRQDMVKQLNAYNNDITAVEVKANAAKKADLDATNATLGADLAVSVDRGKATEEDVMRAERGGIITPAKRVELIRKLDQNLRDGVKKSIDVQRVANAFVGKAYLDPKTSSDDFKAVNYFYETKTKPQLENITDPEQKAAALTYFVNGTGVVPEDLRGEMRGVFRSNNVDKKVFYADLVGRIQESKSQALDDFDTKDIAQAVMIDQMVKAGTPNEQAVEEVTKLTTGINGGRLEVLKTQFEAEARENGSKQEQNMKVLNKVRDAFQLDEEGERTFFAFDASLPDEPQLGVESHAIKDYKNLYETWYYNTNGNAKLAEEQALIAMKRNWGKTDVNGVKGQLSKYPIEAQYPDMPSGEIKKDLISDLKDLGYKDLDPDKVYIQWDPLTARQSHKGATYQVMMPDETGKLRAVEKNDKVLRWKPGVESWFFKKQEEAAKKAVKAQSRAERLKGLPQLEEEPLPYTFNPIR